MMYVEEGGAANLSRPLMASSASRESLMYTNAKPAHTGNRDCSEKVLHGLEHAQCMGPFCSAACRTVSVLACSFKAAVHPKAHKVASGHLMLRVSPV